MVPQLFWFGHKIIVAKQLFLFDSATSYGHADFLTRSQNNYTRAMATQLFFSATSYGHADFFSATSYSHAAFWLGHKLSQRSIFDSDKNTPTQRSKSVESYGHAAFSFWLRLKLWPRRGFDSATSYANAAFGLGHKLCLPRISFDSATKSAQAAFWLGSKLWPRSFFCLTQPQAMATQIKLFPRSFLTLSQAMPTQLFWLSHKIIMPTQLFDSIASYGHAASSFWLSHKLFPRSFLTRPQNNYAYAAFWLGSKLWPRRFFDWATK